MKKSLFYLLFVFAVFLSSCAGTKNMERITVASEQGDCVGVVPMKCLLIKEKGQDVWSFFYNNIEGFDYESGYEYVIDIRKEKVERPPADGSSIKYILVKEVLKTQKASENLPKSLK